LVVDAEDSEMPMNKKNKLYVNKTSSTVTSKDCRFRRSLLSLAVFSSIASMSVYGQNTGVGAGNLEEMVVTGQRTSLENAIEMKKEGDTIADSIVLDEVSKVPSTSLFEILQRVPGVTTNRIRAGNEGSPDGFSFEGSGVQVRGLRGTKALLNGREVYSANGGSGLSFSDIGPELLKTVTTFKSGRADLIEGGIAGTINLETAMPFDYEDTKINAALSASYGDYAESWTPAGSALGSTRFDTPFGEVGVLLDVAYSKIESNDSFIRIEPYYMTRYWDVAEPAEGDEGRLVYAPAGWQAGTDQFERTRKGFYGAVQWQINDQLEFFHTTFISRRESNRDTQFIYPTRDTSVFINPGATFDADGVFLSGAVRESSGNGIAMGQKGTYSPSFSETADYSQGLKYVGDKLTVTGTYQLVEAKSISNKWGLALTAYNRADGVTIDTTSGIGGKIGFVGGPVPRAAGPDSDGGLGSGTSNFPWLEQKNNARTHALSIDVEYDMDRRYIKSVAGGVRYATRKEENNFIGTWWKPLANSWSETKARLYMDVMMAERPDDWRIETFDNFFKGQTAMPADAFMPVKTILRDSEFERLMLDYASCGPDLLLQCGSGVDDPDGDGYVYAYGNPADRAVNDPPKFSTTKPDTQSAYVMFGYQIDSDNPWLNATGNFGLRYVHNEVESSGNFNFTGGTSFYMNEADALASLNQIIGDKDVATDSDIGELTEAWEGELPLTYTSVAASYNRIESTSYDHWLPSFNVKIEPLENVVVRYAVNKTMTPPTFNDIRAQGSASIDRTDNPYVESSDEAGVHDILRGFTYDSGNVTLKPEESINNDFSIEWYPQRGTSAHLSVFHKSIENQIMHHYASATSDQVFGSDIPTAKGENGEEVKVIAPIVGKTNVNADKTATILGFEVGARTYFDRLPGWLSGFGVDANYTYIDSDSPDMLATYMDGTRAKDLAGIGLSESNYNFTLMYDHEKISARLAYSWRDRYLVTTSDHSTSKSYTFEETDYDTGLPVYGAANGRLDGSISYSITDNINIKLNVANMTDEISKTEMEILPGKFVDRSYFITDMRYSLHLGMNF